jgi:hypothetical protein
MPHSAYNRTRGAPALLYTVSEKEKTMKRQFVFAVLLVLAAWIASGQTAKLTEPKAGSYVAGQTQPISWKASGHAKIKLMLYCKNVGKLGVIKSGLKLSAASFPWKVGSLENGKNAPAGNDYLIRIVNMADGTLLDKGPTFSIIEPVKPMPPPPLVMSPKLKIANYSKPPVLVNPKLETAQYINQAQPPPASATFAIKKVTYEFESQGKLRFVDVLISVTSAQDFAIAPTYGDPQYGAQWIAYEINNPAPQQAAGVWISATFSGIFSVKGGGNSKTFSHYPSAPLPAGTREYILSFKPIYNGLVKGCGTFQSMPNGVCRQEFYPKMELDFTAHTAKGTVKASTSVYLIYDTKVWPLTWIGFPGETNLCSGGFQSW